MSVLVTRDAPKSPALDSRVVRRFGERMLRALALPQAELSVLLTDDHRIQQLNRRHRRKNAPTDVLAFPLLDRGELAELTTASAEATSTPQPAIAALGDVVISLDTAARQARARRQSLGDEVCFLLAHGLLHLLGFDHKSDREERAMNRQVQLLVAAASARRPAE